MWWRRLRGRWRATIIAAAAVVIIVAGLSVWILTAGRQSSEVTEAAALDQVEGDGLVESPAPGVPAPGVYSYAQAGWERVGAGPLGVRRELPGTARIAVGAVSPSSFEVTAFLSEEHIEGVRYGVAGGWIREEWRRTDVTLVGIGRDDRRDLRPPPRRVPMAPEVGQTWRDEYEAGSLPVEVSSRIARADELEVGGEAVPVVVIRVESTTGGAHPGTRSETVWWSPERAIPVRWRLEMDVEGVAELTTRTTLELEDLSPVQTEQ
jgi:hypothetical protein